MLPLLFMLSVVTAGILVALQIGDESTWFTYYQGGVVGLFLSSVALEIWNKRKKKIEEEQKKEKWWL
jgi:hypothetical protein